MKIILVIYMLVYESWYVSFRSSFLLDLLYIICMFNIKIFGFIEKIYNFTYYYTYQFI